MSSIAARVVSQSVSRFIPLWRLQLVPPIYRPGMAKIRNPFIFLSAFDETRNILKVLSRYTGRYKATVIAVSSSHVCTVQPRMCLVFGGRIFSVVVRGSHGCVGVAESGLFCLVVGHRATNKNMSYTYKNLSFGVFRFSVSRFAATRQRPVSCSTKVDCINRCFVSWQLCLIQKRSQKIATVVNNRDRLCGLVVRVLGYRFGGPGSIPGTTRRGKKK
jgi:hypothetical protein